MKQSKILVTGAGGQLGLELKAVSPNYPNYDFAFATSEELDITNHNSVDQYITKNNINVIINCAAYTAVDKAETEPVLADAINHLAVKNLAELASKYTIKLIHISTDYVFDGNGNKPYEVEHKTNPINTYGKTKYLGEQAIQEVNPTQAFIIRTSWVYSSFGKNFVKTMLRLGNEKEYIKVVSDQLGTPTYARDLAQFILSFCVNSKKSGVTFYHYTNAGICSWYDFAQEIMQMGNRNCKIEAISSIDFPSVAKRPYYAVLDTTQVEKDFDIQIPYWKSSLQQCIQLLEK